MTPAPSRKAAAFFADGGAMGALIRAHDWDQTPLGPIETWPQSLLTSVSTCLDCAFPILIWWGPDLVMIYNDEYRAILGTEKHPAALGARGADVWPEIWDVIGPMLSQVVEEGVATRSRDLLLVMNRRGFFEETYFSFSYSPIRDETGGVGGVFTPVIETTAKVVGERRLGVLREVAARSGPLTLEAAAAAVAQALATDPHDIPFALIYGLDADGATARLLAASGAEPGSEIAPSVLGARDPRALWPLGAALESPTPLDLHDLRERAPFAPTGVWDAPTTAARILPVTPPGRETPVAVLVIGASPMQALDADQVGFLDLLAVQAGKVFADALAFDEERRRAAALDEINRAKTAFFSNVSHEFRTPLTLMLGPLEDILASSASEPVRQSAQLAHRNAVRLRKLVNTLLDFSRMEAGRLEARFAPLDLSETTAELASGFRSAIESAGLRLIVDTPPLGEAVHADRDLLEKLVLNLLSNALKFTLKGEIEVKVRRADDAFAEITVRDTGVGIAEAEVPRLFERFRRVEAAGGRSFEGSGIGLSLVMEAAQLHGGAVEVDSRLGEGSLFRVRLPFGSAHLPEGQRVPVAARRGTDASQAFAEEAASWTVTGEDAAAPHGARGAATGAHILVADDNGDMRAYLSGILASSGLQVTTAGNGREALDLARSVRPDLIVSDVMMPVMDGIGLLQAVRSDQELHALPVMLVSARAGETDRVEGAAAGADAYLAKPFSAKELLGRVKAALSLAEVRKADLAALARSEERLRLAQDGGRVAVWEVDPASRRTWLSPGAEKLWGLPDGVGVDALLQAVHPDDRDDLARDLEAALHGRRRLDVEFRLLGRGGAPDRWLAARGAVRSDRAGDGNLAGVSFDVTHRRRIEAGLRAANSALETRVAERTAERDSMWRLTGDLMVVMDLQGVIRALNPAWAQRLGWSEETLIGGQFLDLVDPADAPAAAQALEGLARAHPLANLELRLRAQGGAHRWISWSAVADGSLAHAIGRDVTEEKARLLELSNAEEQLRQAQKMEAIGRLTGGVAHDFNNLLTVIRGSADILRRTTPSPERARAYLDAVVEASERAAALTSQLLAFSRRQVLNPETFDVCAQVRGIRTMLETLAGPRIEIRIKAPPAPAYVRADPSQFETAIVNLLVNARDAMEGAGIAEIEVFHAPAGEVMIQVRDHGHGVDPTEIDRIFEPFFTTKPTGAGTGLGLSQVYGFVKQSGGDVSVLSVPGEGAVFTLRLPAAPPPVGGGRAPQPEASLRALEDRRILVVEDNPEIGAFATRLVEELGARAVLCTDGAEALNRIEDDSSGFDIVFTDVVMPGMGGIELAEVLRTRRPGLPVILTTGYSDALAADAAHGYQVVHKPYAVETLARALSGALGTDEAAPAVPAAMAPGTG